MISVNSTVKMTYRNKGTFFGVRVTSTPLDLSYSEITIASGNVSQFRSKKKKQRKKKVFVDSFLIWCLGIADQEVLPNKEEPETRGNTCHQQQNTIVRKWSWAEQFNRDNHITSASKNELRR